MTLAGGVSAYYIRHFGSLSGGLAPMKCSGRAIALVYKYQRQSYHVGMLQWASRRVTEACGRRRGKVRAKRA